MSAITQSAVLLKTKTLAQVGERLTNIPRQILVGASILSNGLPANESQGTPALSAAEVRAVIGEDIATKIEAVASALSP